MPHEITPHNPSLEHDLVEEGFDGGAFRLVERALRELLIEKNVITAYDLRHQIEIMEQRNPIFGAKLIARAWVDTAYRNRLLTNPAEAMQEFGINPDGMPQVEVLENTDHLHHVVVCTLCSCYPRMILGAPPDWYKSPAYRARIVRDPRGVLHEFGTILPNEVSVRVMDSTADLRYLVLPNRPAGTKNWDEAALVGLVTRDCMIGTAIPFVPTP